MTIFSRLIFTIIILPALYLSGVRFISQLFVSTDRSSMFRTALGAVVENLQFIEPGSSMFKDQNEKFHYNLSTIKILILLDPFNADYRYLAARALIDEDLDCADKTVQESIRYSMIDPGPYLLSGWIKGIGGQTEQGYTEFNKAVMLDRKNPGSFAQQGMYLYKAALQSSDITIKSLYNKLSLLSLRTALELDGTLYGNYCINTTMASLYHAAGHSGYALSIMMKLSDDKSPGWHETLQRMALFFELGETVKAISLWKKHFNPDRLSARALNNLESMISKYKSPEFAYCLAQVHTAMGKYQQAIVELTVLVSQKSGNAEYKLALASLYEKTGNNENAYRLYEEAFRISPSNQEAKKKVMEYYAGKKH